jgi:serine/threonine-protein kinase PknG
MADQLYGVLREIVADQEGRPVPAPSTLFTSPLRAGLDRPDWRILPRPQASSDDASAGYLAAITSTDPVQVIAQLRSAPDHTVEVDLRLAAAMIDGGDFDGAETLLEAIEPGDAWEEWRACWYRGVADLARERSADARTRFTAVYSAVPGELAPKLALGLACETAGETAEAGRWYGIVARTDPSITSASFGLARCRLLAGDRSGAIAAYECVPDSSSGHVDAQTARIRCLTASNGTDPTVDELLMAGSILETLPVEGEQRERLVAVMLDAALRLTLEGTASDRGRSLLGYPFAERDLRLGLERSYRALARRAGTRGERIRLVDDANRTRPRTWT